MWVEEIVTIGEIQRNRKKVWLNENYYNRREIEKQRENVSWWNCYNRRDTENKYKIVKIEKQRESVS